ncbi:helix-turn-helix domain-containing protein [Joostella sp.]|uniref:helix-turn-helix domain-containing protein n=1 Tax=Joostella sp. TaxID=2231138 RepID=UPI003A8EE6B5
MSDIEVKKIRSEMGLTQEEFANKLGVHYRTVQKWEAGDTKIRPANAFLIKDIYDKHTKNENNGIILNSNGNEFEELPNGKYLLKAPKVPYTAYASFIEVYKDEYEVNKEFGTSYFTVDKIGLGKYIAFTTGNDSMNGGGIYDTPGGAEVLGRELNKSHWKDGFKKNTYGWIIVCITGIFHKDIVGPNEEGIINCVSRNKSPEFPTFPLVLDDVHSVYKVIKRTF